LYKVLLVEDEEIIRRGIKRGVKWEELEFEVAAEAQDGEEALNYLACTEIDVVMTDVKMPGMNGVDLSKEIKKRYPDIEIVILSGFAEFEYAREAVAFGAFEYMLKPVRKQKIEEVFLRLRQKLDYRKTEEAEIVRCSLILSEGLSHLRQDLMIELLEGKRSVYANLEEEVMRLELDLVTSDVTGIIFRIGVPAAAVEGEANLKEQYAVIFGECLQKLEHCIFVIRDLGEVDIILSGYPAGKDGILYVDQCTGEIFNKIAERIKDEVYQGEEISIGVGIGMTYPSVTHLYKSYIQAKKALEKNFYKKGSFINEFQESIEYEFEKQWVRDYPVEMNHILNQVLEGDIQGTNESIRQMFCSFEEKRLNSEMIKNYCYVLGIMLKNAAYGVIKDRQKEELEDGAFEERIKTMFTIDELEALMQRVFQGMTELVRDSGGVEPVKKNQIILQAKEYIRKNYNKKVSMDDLCRELYLTPTYFSYMFKKETGENYMEYLQKIRMEEAKHLLKTTNLKVYEIVEQVGYSDYKYFTVQFKKYAGISPKEYRTRG